VNFAAATTIVVPTAPATGFAYIADPNGLIEESAKSHYSTATFAKTAKGIFFKTSNENDKPVYSEKSAALEVINKNAGPLIISAKIKKKAEDTGTVVFTNDPDFKGTTQGTVSTDKSVYIAVSDGTNTKAIAAGGAEVELPIALSGKVGNYSLVWDDDLGTDGGYKYDLKSGITTDDKYWNKTSFYVTGFLNENANWSGNDITFPAITVTWDVTAGAVPLKIKNGKASSTTLTYAVATTISKITAGGTEIANTVLTRDKANTATAGTVSVTADQAKALYSAVKAQADGLMLTVEYADGHTEPVVVFAK
jgi:hypothetical protein